MEAKTVTKWFIKKNPYLSNGYMDSNIVLNKLLYFSNLFSYAILDEKVIDDEFVAFKKGPVVFSVYRDYRYNGLNNYPSDDVKVEERFLRILQIVNFVYSDMEPSELVELTHEHNVWQDVRDEIPDRRPPIIFENADLDILQQCRDIYNMYEAVDFDRLKKEVIARNVYYYDSNVFKELPEEIVNELSKMPRSNEPQFVEVIDGDLVLS